MRVLANLVLAGLVCVTTALNAQKGFEVGGHIGVAHYFGDLNQDFNLERPGLAGGLIGRYNFDERVSLRFSANYARVSAYDSDSNNDFQLARNLSFRSDIIEAFLGAEFNFLPYFHGSGDQSLTPYLMGGAGIYYFNSKANFQDEWVALQPLGTEGQPIGGEYNLAQPSIVFGFGLKVDINHVWSLNFELSGRALFSDYLDDVSTQYPNVVELQALRGDLAAQLSDRSLEVRDEAIGEPGRLRGSRNNHDTYAILSVGIVYYIGTLSCPDISHPTVKKR